MRLGKYVLGQPSQREWHEFEVKLVPILALFVLLVLAVLLAYRPTDAPAAAGPVGYKQAAQRAGTPATEAPEKYPTLVSDINAAIATAPNLSASATLIDLTTGKVYNAGSYLQKYEAASTSKLVAIFDYIHQVELGKATLTQTIQGQSAQDIIMRMIIYSDNDAWDKLNHYLGFQPQQAYLDSIGVAGSMVPSNIQFSTPAMAKMLQLLYNGNLMTTEHRAMVLDYMSRTTMNRLIPAALPDGAKVYHKYGQIDGVLHDAAIVEYQGQKFVLVVYTDGGQNAAQTNLIHAVTSAAVGAVTTGTQTAQ